MRTEVIVLGTISIFIALSTALHYITQHYITLQEAVRNPHNTRSRIRQISHKGNDTVRTHTPTFIHAPTYIHTHKQTNKHAPTHIHKHIQTRTYVPSNILMSPAQTLPQSAIALMSLSIGAVSLKEAPFFIFC